MPPSWNVGQAIDYMRETTGLPKQFYELYVVDEGGHFLGAVPTRQCFSKRKFLRNLTLPIDFGSNPSRRFQFRRTPGWGTFRGLPPLPRQDACESARYRSLS